MAGFHCRFLYLELLVIVYLASTSVALSAEYPVSDLEKGILSSRRSIHSYDVVIEVDRLWRGARTRSTYEIWASGRNRRQRTVERDRTTDVCVNDHFGIYYSAAFGQLDNSDRNKWPPVRIDSIATVGSDPVYRMHDPMTIMFNPSFFSWYTDYGLETIINASDRVIVNELSTRWHDRPSIRVSLRQNTISTLFEYEAVPSLGNSIVEMRGSGETPSTDGSSVQFKTDCACGDLREIAPSIWFPTELRTTTTIDGKIREDETLRISFKAVNSTISTETFEVVGMDLPAGILVIDNTKFWHTRKSPTTYPTALIWDGKKVRPWTSADSARNSMSAVPLAQLETRSTPRWRVWVSGILLAAGVILMGWYFFSTTRVRRPTPP